MKLIARARHDVSGAGWVGDPAVAPSVPAWLTVPAADPPCVLVVLPLAGSVTAVSVAVVVLRAASVHPTPGADPLSPTVCVPPDVTVRPFARVGPSTHPVSPDPVCSVVVPV